MKVYRSWPRLDSYHLDTGTSKFALRATRRRRPFFGTTMPARGQRKQKPKSIAATRLPAAVPVAPKPSVFFDLHIDDMKEVGKAPGRSKSATLEMLQRRWGALRIRDLDRERLIRFGRDRAKEGAGPMTVGMDIGAIKLIVTHVAAVHGIEISAEPVQQARIALNRLGLVGKSNERDRRPAEEELLRLFARFDASPTQIIPMIRIIKFAIATAMRQEEICRVTWSDLNARTKMLTIRDRKDPRAKKGNDIRIPLLDVSGYDALA